MLVQTQLTMLFYIPITDPFTHENGVNIETTKSLAKGTLGTHKGDSESAYTVLRNFAYPKPGSCLVSHRDQAIIFRPGIPGWNSVTCGIFLLSWHTLHYPAARNSFCKEISQLTYLCTRPQREILNFLTLLIANKTAHFSNCFSHSLQTNKKPQTILPPEFSFGF